MSSSSQAAQEAKFLPGNARVIMGSGNAGPAEMTVHEMEGVKKQTLDEAAELAFWTRVQAKAQAKAQEILAQAMAQAESIREQARQEGLAQGYADATADCEAQVGVFGQTLAGLLAGLEGERAGLWAAHRADFAALLRLGVEKTLHVELSTRRQEALSALMDQAVDLLDTKSGFTVVVAPEDEAATQILLEQAKAAHPGLGHWRVKTDPALAAGGVRLESEAGMVDNTVDARFAQIAELLERVSFDPSQA